MKYLTTELTDLKIKYAKSIEKEKNKDYKNLLINEFKKTEKVYNYLIRLETQE